MHSERRGGRLFEALLGEARTCFSAPGFAIFETLVRGWVTAPGRRTITAMICAADPEGRRSHDAYHRFVRAGRWSTNALWQVLVVHLVGVLCPSGTLLLDCDDTLYKKSGRKIEGAGSFRDAVRSTRNKVVYATGLNLVVVTLRVRPPWGGVPIGVPVGVRLHRKGGPTTLELAIEIITELSCWLPERSFSLCADGAYASLAGRGLPRTVLSSRMRRDAALYEPAPPRTGERGRPRKRGGRLATPAEMAGALDDGAFTAVRVDFRGSPRDLLVWPRPVLWFSVDPEHRVLLVIVRDPEGVMHDDCATRTQRRSRCRRSSQPMWCCARDGGVALRDRPAGGGPKPPSGAPVKSRGAERDGKGGLEPVRCEPRRRARANHSMTGRKRSDGIESGVESLPRDEPGGNLSTAQAVPGLKVARARFRLWCGTCEPGSRYRLAVHWTLGPPAGESETPKWQKPQGAE
jgi:hypothetical protein